MCHILFIHPSVDEHLGFFPVLVVVNSAAMNIGEHVVFQAIFSLYTCPGVELQGHMVVLFLVF